MAAGQAQHSERINVLQVIRDMVAAGADPASFSDEQRAEIMAEYDRARQPGEVARADSPDMLERMLAARAARSAAMTSTCRPHGAVRAVAAGADRGGA